MKKRKKRKARKAQDPSVAPVTAERAYDAAIPTPQRRRPIGADLSQDVATEEAIRTVRDWGRYLDENHDVAGGILDELVKNIVGGGIVTVPKPLQSDGKTVDMAFAEQIVPVWDRWMRQADTSGELSWYDCQRLTCRGWLRDGEYFLQHITGRQRGYRFARSQVPYRIELLESEMVPEDLSDDEWRMGIRHDGWRRPIEYAVYREHPGDFVRGFLAIPDPRSRDIVRVPAPQMTHVKVAKRWPATRGISVFANSVARLYDIKDLEESERIKNRNLSNWIAAIIKSPDVPGHENKTETGQRFIDSYGGTVIDTLAVGETIQGVGPDYPITGMPDHIADQHRRLAAGTGTRYSSISKRYDGNYSAQRQEMVESEGLYQMREDTFIAKVCREIYERWLTAAVLDGQIVLPVGMDLEAATNAEYRGPVTPWVDPLKEVQADSLAVEKGFITLEQVQIKRGASPEIIGREPVAAPAPPTQLTLIDEPAEEVAA